jgi:hypothetical protein
MSETPEGHRGDIRPIPDPTALTTEASVRLEEMLRGLIASEVAHLDALFSEKLVRIEVRFEMLDERTAEQKKDMKDALDAALAAQKGEAAAQTASLEKNIGKSETATIERIKTVETLLSTFTRVSDDKIDDLKSRIVAIEAVKLGNTEQTANMRASGTDTRGNMASIISVITAFIAVVSIVITIIIVVTKP